MTDQFNLFMDLPLDDIVRVVTASPPCVPFAQRSRTPITTDVNVSGLRRAADAMEKRIEFCRRDRLENTRKRRQEAEHFRREAERLEKSVAQLNNLADALVAGTVPVELAQVRTKAHVQLINGYEPDRPHYQPDEKAFTRLNLFTRDARMRARVALEGYAEVQIPEAEQKRRRLVEVRSEISSYKITGFVRSTEIVIDSLLSELDLQPGQRVLEPSAGDGVIAERVKAIVGSVDVCEIVPRLRECLELQEFNIVASDFLGYEPGAIYDRIVGNPPFEKLADIDHVRHAYDLLVAGGWLAMVMSASPFFRDNKKAIDFRTWFDEVGGCVTDLPDGAFKASGTGVSSKYVLIQKAR